MENPINYPSEEILEPILGKPNFEFILLWMLNNNVTCTWANLKTIIKPSTLSIYLKKLIENNQVSKTEFNQYSITQLGKDRFYELSQSSKQKRRLSYPPKLLLYSGRNYDHWVLWMVHNNNYCVWADFQKPPLSINNSSLSKTMIDLLEKGFIRKEDKKYRITQFGKFEYSKMLRYYDLDRHSIIEAESNRIKEITKKTITFFEKFKINNDEVKFRYLNNVLRLSYDTVKSTLEKEEDFHKILLFLSLNHPSQYPHFISNNEFAAKYDIEQVILDFHIHQIVEKNIYPIKFFILEINTEEIYYLQVNEKLERMLYAVVEEHIAKLTFLNKLYEDDPKERYALSLKNTISEILEEICMNLFNEGLKDSLRPFLVKYIDYLAFKIEKEKKLVEAYDKLEGLIWHEVKAFNIELPTMNKLEEALKQADEKIASDPENLNLYHAKEHILIYFNKYTELLDLLEEMLERFPKEVKEIRLKQAFVLKEQRNLDEGFNIIKELIVKYPQDKDLIIYKVYWLQYLNEKEKALNLIRGLIDDEPQNGVYHDTYGEILMAYRDYENAIREFQKTIEINNETWYSFQTYIKLGICYKELGKFELAREYLIRGKDFTNKSTTDFETKQKWLTIVDLFLSEIEEMREWD